MKKLIFLLFGSILLSGCSCLLSQIPPKYVYANTSCQALIPDYKTQVTVTGGCTGFAVTQIPAAGTLLTATNKVANVIIKATGTNGKSSQISFTVTMIDTITPKITPLPSLLAYQLDQEAELFKAAGYIARHSEHLIDSTFNISKGILVHQQWDSAGYWKGVTFFQDSTNIQLIKIDSTTISLN